MARAVPSTLHQKVKFVVEEQLISVAVEEDIVATLTTFNFILMWMRMPLSVHFSLWK